MSYRNGVELLFIKIRCITLRHIIQKLPFPTFFSKVFPRKKLLYSIQVLLMTLYRYHSLAVYRKNVHDMKSHNIQEITFSCHTKKLFSRLQCSMFDTLVNGVRRCKTIIIHVKTRYKKADTTRSKRLITEA